MIVKSFELNKIKFDKINLILFYGKNEGLKSETIKNLFKKTSEVINYEEKEILNNSNDFIESILSKSLFNDEKILIIKRASDKILKIINEIETKKIGNTKLIISAENLEKKSKLRSLFEKNKEYICTAFYEDDAKTLSILANNFFKEKNIPISSANINIIINKCNGDRINLFNELNKIELFSKSGKKITSENLTQLINLTENHKVSELIDNCLAKNQKITLKILNENNFTSEDCILITRSLLNKAKKILSLVSQYERNNNIDLTISSAKPPIFWKDKEITKRQIFLWSSKKIKNLIYELMELELKIKKNINQSINLITDFILNKSNTNFNNET